MNELIHILIEDINYLDLLLTNEHIIQLKFVTKNLNQDHDEKINDQINSFKNKNFIFQKQNFFF